jgi:hypothetical protein
MPSGVPKGGRRLTLKRKAEGWTKDTIHLLDYFEAQKAPSTMASMKSASVPAAPAAMPVPDASATTDILPQATQETDAEIAKRLAESFGILGGLIKSAIYGKSRAVIVSGAPGVGKSYTVEELLAEWDDSASQYTISRGYVKATGLFKLLWDHRHANSVLVFDDADAIFGDDVALNLLKAACDTTEKRTISWLSEFVAIDADGMQIQKKFEFFGRVIFITNLNFDRLIAKSHKLGPHLAALMSRAHYIDLGLDSLRAQYVRVTQVAEVGLFDEFEFENGEAEEILEFMSDNLAQLREVSLRMAIKIANLRVMDAKSWIGMAKATCLRK